MRTFMPILMMVISLASSASSQDCIDYGEYLHWVDRLDTPGDARDVDLVDGRAYVADGPSGLQIFDISDPHDQHLIGSVDMQAEAVAVAGDYAYVLDGDFDLQVIDLAILPDPRRIAGSAAMLDGPADLVVVGSRLYVAGAGLQIFDLADPAAPQLLGGIDLPPGDAFAVSGDHVYLVRGDDLLVVEVTDPTSPQLVGSVDTGCSTTDLAVLGHHVLVISDDAGCGGLQVFDVTDPNSPLPVGSLELWPAVAITASGDHAYVAGVVEGAFSDELVLQVVDLADPTAPQLLADVRSTGTPWGSLRVEAIAATAGFVFVASGDDGLQSYDVANPTDPPSIGSEETDRALDVVVLGDYAYVADAQAGLRIIDVSDPASPALVGTADTPGWAQGVAVSGGHAYVADCGGGLQVIDIADPTMPQVVGHLNTEWAAGIDVSGSKAFVVNILHGNGLDIIDVSDPTDPRLVGHVEEPVGAWSVTVVAGFAYIANQNGGLLVIDVTDPTTPQIAGSVPTAGTAKDVVVAGSFAYVANGASGLAVVDVHDPGHPELVASLATPNLWGGRGVAANLDMVYVADSAGLLVVDVSTPVSPVVVGAVDTDVLMAAERVRVANGRIFVADRGQGLRVLPLQCPDEVSVEDSLEDTTGDATPAATLQLSVHPNPFNPRTSISFFLPRSGRAEIGVYELTGRRVAVLAARSFPAGRHTLDWNGRDAAGRALPSGTYLVRVETASATGAQKLMLVR
jgi:hypothetical protein